VGGLVGVNAGTVTASNATGTVTGNASVGGLVGVNAGTVTASNATGTVTGNASVGGLVGVNAGTVTASNATGTVTGNASVGGLVGVNAGTVTASNATADVDAGGATNVGGLVGNNSAIIRETYATSATNGSDNVGGLVGRNSDGLVTDSYAVGAVNGSANVGGLVGYNTGSGAMINRSYAAGETTPDHDSTGGLVGANDGGGTVTDAYWDIATTGQSTSAGSSIALTTSAMKGGDAERSLFTFENTWAVVNRSDEISYPYLEATPQIPAPGLETVSGNGTPADKGTDEGTGSNDSASSPSSGSGGRLPVSNEGETVVAVEGTTGDGEPGDGEETTDDSTSRMTVTVSNPRPGQTLVIDQAGVSLRGEAGEQAGDEQAGGTGGGETDGASPNNIRADRLSVAINTDQDFELSVAIYENDLTPSTAIGSGLPAASSGAAPPQAKGIAMIGRLPAWFQQRQTTAPEEVRTAAASFEEETGTVSAGYVQIEHTLASEAVAGATFEFSIRRTYLEALGVEPEAVELHHRSGGHWAVQATEHVGSDDTHHRFEATMPSFSVFALGTGASTVAVTDASLAETTANAGEVATITASVENRGRTAAAKTVELTLDGEVVDTETVSLDGGETADVTLGFTSNTPGTYDLAVGSIDLQQLTIREESMATEPAVTAGAGQSDTTTGTVAAAADDSGGGLPWGRLILVGLVAAVLSAAFLRRWRADDSERDDPISPK
jgi:hypothetical protein